MKDSLWNTSTITIALVLFVAMILLAWAGNSYARYRLRKDAEIFPKGDGSMIGSLLGLLALLLAFTFSMSSLRYETRRQLIIEESNAISTALLRADLYPDSIRRILRSDFRKYLEARIQFDSVGFVEEKIQETLDRSNEFSLRIWNTVSEQNTVLDNMVISNQMIPAVNSMIDIVTTREVMRNAHVPQPILWLLLGLCMASSFLIGYSRKGKKMDWTILIGFVLMTVITIFFIFDLDRPRRGVINLKKELQCIVELRKMF